MNRRRRSVLVAAPLGIAAAVLGSRRAEAAPPSKAQAAKAAFSATEADFRAGRATAEDVYLWSKRWLEAERTSNAAAAKDHLARMKALEATVKANLQTGTSTKTDAFRCAYYVVEAAG
ncbi:MAG: hypothetical protein HOW73_27125 [Polyangiaceae bacterium]|nr:hypothetical protein [Polyangiaceae bacterium]